MRSSASVAVIVMSACSLAACSTVMEANRPEPVSLNQYAVGEPRMDVISRLGAPTSSIQDGANNCDIYKLYTNGIGKIGKGAIILGEAAADFFTLGLAEVVTTPGEAVTKNKLHTVLFCYSKDRSLVSIADEGSRVVGAYSAANVLAASSSEPSTSAAEKGAPPSGR